MRVGASNSDPFTRPCVHRQVEVGGGRLAARRRRAGRPVEVRDLQIAGIALVVKVGRDAGG